VKDILDQLREEHGRIEATIRSLLGGRSGCPSGKGFLDLMEELIINHVSREDSGIYGPLKKISRISPDAAGFLEISRRQLEEIKILSLVFFEKYKGEKEGALCAGFHGDLERLGEKIRARIAFEDEELFPFLRNLWATI
jgi:hypothetical protein